MAKIMISLSDKLLKEIDAVAKREHRSRSELIREAARQYINEGARLGGKKGFLSQSKGFLWLTLPYDEDPVH